MMNKPLVGVRVLLGVCDSVTVVLGVGELLGVSLSETVGDGVPLGVAGAVAVVLGVLPW